MRALHQRRVPPRATAWAMQASSRDCPTPVRRKGLEGGHTAQLPGLRCVRSGHGLAVHRRDTDQLAVQVRTQVAGVGSFVAGIIELLQALSWAQHALSQRTGLFGQDGPDLDGCHLSEPTSQDLPGRRVQLQIDELAVEGRRVPSAPRGCPSC